LQSPVEAGRSLAEPLRIAQVELQIVLGLIHGYFPFCLGRGTGSGIGGGAGLRGLRFRFGAGRGGWCDFGSRNFIVCLSAAATGARLHHARG
jgi:hypothetical protein